MLMRFLVVTALILKTAAPSYAEDNRTKELKLAGTLCNLLSTSKEITKEIPEALKLHFKKYDLGEPTTENLLRYLNTNKHRMHCNNLNWLKGSIGKGKYSALFKVTFLEVLITDEVFIDVNAVDLRDGNPETLLDYMDFLIADKAAKNYTVTNLHDVRDLLVDQEDGFAAKKWADLSQADQDAFWAYHRSRKD